MFLCDGHRKRFRLGWFLTGGVGCQDALDSIKYRLPQQNVCQLYLYSGDATLKNKTSTGSGVQQTFAAMLGALRHQMEIVPLRGPLLK